MPKREPPPIRDPQSPGYVSATMLVDGDVPPIDTTGNYIVGPTHATSKDLFEQDGVPQGRTVEFTMDSKDSSIYPGIARDKDTFGTPDPDNPAKLIVKTSHPTPYSRPVAVYIPRQLPEGADAPFVIGTDGPNYTFFKLLDNLIHQGRIPPVVGISMANGGGDAQGSQRGHEYDTMSGLYAEYVETEVLPRVEAEAGLNLTKDPDKRVTMGCSSGASCAMSMAWYRNDLYHRILSFSGTYINQQWPWNPETPQGAWGYHTTLIPESPPKPIRIWMCVADQDLYNPNIMRDDMHDWVLANQHMARVLAEKDYDYQFSFVRNAFHCDPKMYGQLWPQAMEWIWRD